MFRSPSPIHGLYLVSDEPCRGDPEGWAGRMPRLLAAGVDCFQLRDKAGVVRGRPEIGRRIAAACRGRGIPFIVNDDIALAVEIGADGVHLGRDDASLAEARRRLGKEAIVGVSCYDSLALARDAEAGGADYVAFGSCFASPTKPGASQVPPGVLHAARQALKLPIVAIGGITEERLPVLRAAGIDAIAVVSAVFQAPDPEAAVRRLAAGWRRGSGGPCTDSPNTLEGPLGSQEFR